ncbi:MAG: AAA family ATPase [Gemmataceae bacterium]
MESFENIVTRLSLLVQAGNPIITIESRDEPRVVDLLRAAAVKLARPLFSWSITQGLRRLLPDEEPVQSFNTPAELMAHLSTSTGRAIYLLHDLAPHCQDPLLQRQLWEMHHYGDEQPWTLVLLDPVPLPEAVSRLGVPQLLGWPDASELDEVVRTAYRQAHTSSGGKTNIVMTREQREQLVQTLRGLGRADAGRIVKAAMLDDHTLDANDLPRIIEAKRDLLGRLGCLEPIGVNVTVEQVGGLARLKAWLKRRRSGFTDQARQFGLEAPRGVLLLGVQGCGKSLCARMIAASWGMPLLRLDPSNLYQRFVGDSESRLRDALRQAETMAPVVLWIDEIEKAFASASAASADGGLSQRLFGTLLSWLQDHRHPIFVAATANDVQALPPELLRKGRFDEVFFIDLPQEDERRHIFAAHLQRRRRPAEVFDLDQLARASAGFNGAEIEQAVIAGLFDAFDAGKPFDTACIIQAIETTQPLSVLMRERVEQLRAWAAQRCVPAS